MLGMMPIYAGVSLLTGQWVYLLTASVLIPLCLIATGLSAGVKNQSGKRCFVDKAGLLEQLQDGLSMSSRTHRAGCVILKIDTDKEMLERWGGSICPNVSQQIADRLEATLRSNDMICELPDGQFAIALPQIRMPDLGAMLSLVSRLQNAVGSPITNDGVTMRLTVSAGFCLESQAPARTAKALFDAATAALEDARRHAPSGVRGYSPATPTVAAAIGEPFKEFVAALREGEIVPWFQPQVCGDTGKVIGFEALARWDHPQRGPVAPREFLPALEQTGHLEELSEVMLNHSLKALKAWDRAGFHVPAISVNFAAQELRNPGLVERIKWDVDRFSLEPKRLTVEILETVFSNHDDDIIARNIRSLGTEGFGIDLDDFGTGHASLGSIRRFNVNRIKIDRSFVSNIDEDPDQQKMVAGIIALAEQLGLQTLAEGVETLGEKSILAQLGCSAMQGYSVGRPMPFEQTLAWLDEHDAKLRMTPSIPKRAS